MILNKNTCGHGGDFEFRGSRTTMSSRKKTSEGLRLGHDVDRAPKSENRFVMRVIYETGIRSAVQTRKVWPWATVTLFPNSCLLVVTGETPDVREFRLGGCTLHHSRLTMGCLGIGFTKKDCQLLLSGRPVQVRQLFSEILSATAGQVAKLRGSAAKKYGHLQGVASKRRRQTFLVDGRVSGDGHATNGASVSQSTSVGLDVRLPPDIAFGLTHEQRLVCEATLRGESVFFTGGAGTGKSYLLRQLLKVLDRAVSAVTAPTALAASQLGGSTLHQWAGVGRGEGEVARLERDIRRRRDVLQRWRSVKTLVIDEISMVDGQLFVKLDALGRVLRGSERPFGGIQLILAGDFMQLPPVVRGESQRTFCFEAHIWAASVPRSFELTKVFRQGNDLAFCGVLNDLRFGTLSAESEKLLLPRLVHKGGVHGDGEDLITRLMPRRAEVDRVNSQAMRASTTEIIRFDAHDTGDSEELDQLTTARRELELRVGALVVLTRTLSPHRRLVNGCQGRVVAFTGVAGPRRPVVAFPDLGVEVVVAPEAFEARRGTQVLGVRTQLPLELAWALSVHKSQGMSLGKVEVSLEAMFEHGQAYVAFSRAESLAGLTLVGDQGALRRSIRAEPRCLAFHRALRCSTEEGNSIPAAAPGESDVGE